MIKRLVILQFILLGGLSAILLLPRTPPMKMAALVHHDGVIKLPNFLTLTGWRGGPMLPPSKEEKEYLAKDTEFYRRDYRREVGMSDQQELIDQKQQTGFYRGLVDVLNAGIVLSGKDLTGSIHALERCLGAQGFNIRETSTMHVTLRTGHKLAVRRLLCEKAVPEAGQVMRNISYYWFVGHDYVTSNHIKRGLKDFADRVLRGYDQRWAYITVTANLDPLQLMELPPGAGKDSKPRPVRDDTGTPLVRRGLTPVQADALVSEFMSDFVPDVIAVDNVREWPEE